jgi:maleylacetoacetate isomerase
MRLRLYGYHRSSAAYRVRIAMFYKGLAFESLGVHLLNNEQMGEAYRAISSTGLVPCLQQLPEEPGTALNGEAFEGQTPQVLGQSLAILEYLEASVPEPALLPGDAWFQAQIRALALDVACDIHPLNNLRVQLFLMRELGHTEAQRDAWVQHWMAVGFAGIEPRLQAGGAPYCMGNQPTLADVCLIPQVVNALRFHCDLTPWPRIRSVYENCMVLPCFAQTHPDVWQDAPLP